MFSLQSHLRNQFLQNVQFYKCLQLSPISVRGRMPGKIMPSASTCPRKVGRPESVQYVKLFDEEIRRFLREGIICIPTPADVPAIITAVKAYIRRQHNPLLDRIEFYQRHQQRGESFDSFYTSLKELFSACDFFLTWSFVLHVLVACVVPVHRHYSRSTTI